MESIERLSSRAFICVERAVAGVGDPGSAGFTEAGYNSGEVDSIGPRRPRAVLTFEVGAGGTDVVNLNIFQWSNHPICVRNQNVFTIEGICKVLSICSAHCRVEVKMFILNVPIVNVDCHILIVHGEIKKEILHGRVWVKIGVRIVATINNKEFFLDLSDV